MRADSRHTSQVRNDDGVIDFKRRGDRRPHVARVAEPVQQHNRGAMTAHRTCRVVPLAAMLAPRKSSETLAAARNLFIERATVPDGPTV